MGEFRIIDANGNVMNFTCQNAKFKTDINSGHPHGPGNAKGSVFDDHLVQWPDGADIYSLWLEHVVHSTSGHKYYWLMWYKNGIPTIPLSGVFGKAELERFAQKMASCVP